MASLPSYVAAAQPIPQDKRVPWFKTTAQTYAGVMLWFVFWDSVPTIAPTPATPGGLLARGSASQFSAWSSRHCCATSSSISRRGCWE